MANMVFLDFSGIRLTKKHEWMHNQTLKKFNMECPIDFIPDFGLFGGKICVKKKQHFFLGKKSKIHFIESVP